MLLDSNTHSIHGENRLHRRRCQLLRRNSSCCNHARALPFLMTNCLPYHLNHGHLSFHHNGNVDNLVQELHLCNLHDLPHNLNCCTGHCRTTGMFTTLLMKEITNSAVDFNTKPLSHSQCVIIQMNTRRCHFVSTSAVRSAKIPNTIITDLTLN